MHLQNSILSSLDIDSSEFLYKNDVKLYVKDKKSPYGKVTFDKGRYRLTVGDLSLNEPSKHRYE